jgi:hypothetical protein
MCSRHKGCAAKLGRVFREHLIQLGLIVSHAQFELEL